LPRVRFEPNGREVEVAAGENLLRAAILAGAQGMHQPQPEFRRRLPAEHDPNARIRKAHHRPETQLARPLVPPQHLVDR